MVSKSMHDLGLQNNFIRIIKFRGHLVKTTEFDRFYTEAEKSIFCVAQNTVCHYSVTLSLKRIILQLTLSRRTSRETKLPTSKFAYRVFKGQSVFDDFL